MFPHKIMWTFCSKCAKTNNSRLWCYNQDQNDPDRDGDWYKRCMKKVKSLGNFIHNVNVLKTGGDDLVVVKRPCKDRNVEEYLPNLVFIAMVFTLSKNYGSTPKTASSEKEKKMLSLNLRTQKRNPKIFLMLAILFNKQSVYFQHH